MKCLLIIKKALLKEHLHVRETQLGIFDVSHMGQILIPANDSTKYILSLETYIPLNIKKIPS